MFCLLRQRLLSEINLTRNLTTTTTHFVHLLEKTLCLRSFSAISADGSSFTVSYLVNSCGLSPEAALNAAKKVQFNSPRKPDLVVEFFQTHGFTKTQIANLAAKRPVLLLAKPEKTLLPKLNFLKQFGFSEPDIADFLSTDPTFLSRSLERQIIPSFRFLKSLLGTNENVATSIKSSCTSWILQFNLERIIGHKVEILRRYGVPEENIAKLIMVRPRSLSRNNDWFDEMVKNVSEMGLDPLSMQFANALHILAGMKKDKLESKLEIFRSFGWSEDEIISAIRNQPLCISISEEKLRSGLDFFMNNLKWEPSDLAKCSNLLGLSLEKRIIPRWTVIQYLLSKCLIKGNINIRSVLKLTDAKFLERYLAKYESKAPELLTVYLDTITQKVYWDLTLAAKN